MCQLKKVCSCQNKKVEKKKIISIKKVSIKEEKSLKDNKQNTYLKYKEEDFILL